MKSTDFLGLTNVKFLNVSIMITIHCLVWIGTAYSFQLFKHDFGDYFIIFYSFSFFSMSIPVTAGAMFRIYLDKYFQNKKLLNFPSEDAVKLALFLGLLESIKSSLTFGITHFFTWNVLHFLGLSMVVTMLLSKIKIIWVIVLGVFSLVSAPIIRVFFLNYSFIYGNKLIELHSQNISFFILLTLGLITSYYLTDMALAKKNVKLYTKISIYLLIQAGLLFVFYNFKNELFNNEIFSFNLLNLPFSILTTIKRTTHLWPLFPWYFIFAAGFIISDYRLSKYYNKFNNFIILSLSILSMVIFYYYEAMPLFKEISHKDLFGEKLFQPGPIFIITLVAVFIISSYFSEWIASFVKYHKYGIHKSFSRGIFIIYIFHFIIGFKLTHYLATFLSLAEAIFIIPLAMHVISYFLGLIYITINDYTVKINLRKLT